MVLGSKYFGILPGHKLKANELLWYAKGQMRDFRFFGIYIGWLFIGFAYGKSKHKTDH